MNRSARLVACAAALAFTAGCGSSDVPIRDDRTDDDPPRIERPSVGALPKLEEPFPVDDGRIEVARPLGWKPETALRKGVVYLCRASAKASYPRIYVLADDYPGLEGVTADNVQKFASAIRSQLRLEKPNDKREVSAVLIGQFAGAAYSGRGRTENDRDLDLLTLVTVSRGRKYSLQLQADPGTLATYTPHLHAMAHELNLSPSKEDEAKSFGAPESAKTVTEKASDKAASGQGVLP